MNELPVYLTWFLVRIRKHSGESDYFLRRLRAQKSRSAYIEAQMIHELADAGLIAVPEDTWAVIVEYGKWPPLLVPVWDIPKSFEGAFVEFPTDFHITPCGHYFLRERLVSLTGRLLIAGLSGFVCFFLGLWLGGR